MLDYRLATLAAAFAFTFSAPLAHAAVVAVNSEAALGANDQMIWNGTNFSDGAAINTDRSFSTPATWQTVAGFTGGLSASGGSLQRQTQGTTWSGDFLNGEFLIYQPYSETAVRGGTGTSEPVTIRFDTPIYGFGFQTSGSVNYSTNWTLELGVYDVANTLLGTFIFSGVSSSATQIGGGNNPFVGALSNVANISYARIITIAGSTPGGDGYGFNQLRLLTSNQAIPEPATLALLGIGLASIGTARRRRGSIKDSFH